MSSQQTQRQSSIGRALEAGRARTKIALRPVHLAIRRVARFLIWVLPALGRLALPAAARRLLVVYDTSSQPFSIGDLLIFQEASLVLCQKHRLDVVDMAVVYDPAKPASSDPVFSKNITPDNFLYHLAALLPVVQVNQNLGSLFIFSSTAHLQRYISDNIDRYHVWPSGWLNATRDYLSSIVFNDLLHEHYKAYGSIPHLSCRPFMRDWAAAFYAEHVRPGIPVTVNLRNNRDWHVHRNSQIDCWVEFFQHSATRYPAKFVIICARSEIDDRLRACSNVVIAKDHHTGIEQDMALIHSSAAHMGAGSGPATMAWFGSKPYLMVNTTYKGGEFFERPGMIRQEESDIQRFWFAGPQQRIANGTETTELLIREFALIWKAVDLERWQSAGDAKSQQAQLRTWLR